MVKGWCEGEAEELKPNSERWGQTHRKEADDLHSRGLEEFGFNTFLKKEAMAGRGSSHL